jgi:phosphate starvation-inducible PhoH-like protein
METNKPTGSKKLKHPIKFNIALNEEQKIAKEKILNSKVAFLKGAAGSGKSMLAAQIALDLLFRKEIEKVILTRPAVTAGEDIGFLPGSKDDKLAPYTASIYDNMYRLYSKDKIDKELAEGNIEVIPIGFMRGRNFSNCCVIIDESQNVTQNQLELIITRLCSGARMIFVGDTAQIDLKDKKQSGFDFMSRILSTISGINSICLTTNHRDPIVEEILQTLKGYN